MNSVAYMTTAPMGGYKSYSRGASYVMDEFLPEQDGRLYTTIPLNLDEIVIEAEKKGISEEVVRDRIHVIDSETVNKWTEDGSISGPWEMDYKNLKGAHLQFDEFHHYCPRTGEVERRRLWREWIAEIRHEHATIEFLTQDMDAIDDLLTKKIALRKELVNQETSRDPYFKIPMGDWYEIKGLFCGFWSPCVWEIEWRKVNRKWVETGHQRKIYPKARYYDLYNSFSKPHRRQREESKDEPVIEEEKPEKNLKLKQFQKRSTVGLLLWFFRRNLWSLTSRFAFLLAVIWVCFLGGGGILLNEGMAYFEDIPSQFTEQNTEKPINNENLQISEKTEAQKLIELNPVILTTNFDGKDPRNYTVTDIKELVIEHELLLLELDELDDKIAVLENTASKLQMIGSDYVVFDSGITYFENDILKESGYYGKKIQKITRDQSYILLDDGSRVTLNGLQNSTQRRSSVDPTLLR